MGGIFTISKGTAMVRINKTLFSFFEPNTNKRNPYYFKATTLYWAEFFDDQGRRFFVVAGFHQIDQLKHLAERIAKVQLQWTEREGTEVVCESTFSTDRIPEGSFVMNGRPLKGIVYRDEDPE